MSGKHPPQKAIDRHHSMKGWARAYRRRLQREPTDDEYKAYKDGFNNGFKRGRKFERAVGSRWIWNWRKRTIDKELEEKRARQAAARERGR